MMRVDLETRRPVWDALSTLFLDTDIGLLREYRAKVLAESPYTLEEVEQILRNEVFPVCSWNLLSVAGEWAGFDQEWLEDRITRRLKKRWRVQLGFGHRMITRSSEWKATKLAVQQLRHRGV